VALLRWLSPAAALSGLYYFLTNYLFFARRTGLLSTITVVVSTAQLGLTVVLVDYLGVRGAAIATLVGAAAYFVAIWAASQFAISMPWRLTAPVSK
jgi:O-antigen/teichoic acid export membrane protein